MKMGAARVFDDVKFAAKAGADVVVEVVGLPSAVVEGLHMLRLGGKYVVLGQVSVGEPGTIPFSPITMLGKNIVSAGCYDPWVLPVAMEFIARNQDKYPFDKIVSNTFPLAEVNAAFEQAEWDNRQTSVTRAVLVP